MAMPNIGIFIFLEIITVFFIPVNWLPNENLASPVDTMVTYLLLEL